MAKLSLGALLENRVLRISALAGALMASTTAGAFFWPSPTTGEYRVHVGDFVEIAGMSLDAMISRIDVQMIALDEQIDRAQSRDDAKRVRELRQRRKRIDRKLKDLEKKREKF